MKILILSRPQINIDTFLNYLAENDLDWVRTDNAKGAEEIVEIAGRNCYFSFGSKQSSLPNKDFIKRLIKSQHTSVLEHVNWTFFISGVSRAFSHQLVRHRVGFSFSQLSQQFFDESDCDFVSPPQLENKPECKAIWEDTVKYCKKAYSMLQRSLEKSSDVNHLQKKIINNISRSVLPNATETKIVMTANARALRSFLEIRGNVLCDLEMRIFCSNLLEILQDESMTLFYDFSCLTQDDGTPRIVREKTQKDNSFIKL